MPGTPVTEVTVGGITAKISNGLFGYQIDRERGPSRTVTYHLDVTPGDNTGAKFCDALMGVGNYASAAFGFPQPHRYPANQNLICERARLGEFLGGMAPSDQLGDSDALTIIADYSVIPWDVTGEQYHETVGVQVPWSSLSTRGGFEEYELTDLTTETSSTSVRRFKIRVPTVTYQYRRSMIPSFFAYDVLLANLSGKLNSTTFFGKPRGTVQLDDWIVDDNRDASGQWIQEFSMDFRWRREDWNKVVTPGKSDTWEFVKDDLGHYPLEYASFDGLLYYGLV